jgi:hypothetical protein
MGEPRTEGADDVETARRLGEMTRVLAKTKVGATAYLGAAADGPRLRAFALLLKPHACRACGKTRYHTTDDGRKWRVNFHRAADAMIYAARLT